MRKIISSRYHVYKVTKSQLISNIWRSLCAEVQQLVVLHYGKILALKKKQGGTVMSTCVWRMKLDR